ncbi:MAG: hypothetical protein ABIQ70_12380 [Dokdonella sp.]
MEHVAPRVAQTLAERRSGGSYIVVGIDREAESRHALNIDDIQGIVSAAIGGGTIGETVEGRQRFPIGIDGRRNGECAAVVDADHARLAEADA